MGGARWEGSRSAAAQLPVLLRYYAAQARGQHLQPEPYALACRAALPPIHRYAYLPAQVCLPACCWLQDSLDEASEAVSRGASLESATSSMLLAALSLPPMGSKLAPPAWQP